MNRKITAACLAATGMFAAVPAFAQTSGGAAGTGSGGTSGQTYTTEQRNDNRDWGWIGLLGLAGLAGLKRRDTNDHRRDVSGRTA